MTIQNTKVPGATGLLGGVAHLHNRINYLWEGYTVLETSGDGDKCDNLFTRLVFCNIHSKRIQENTKAKFMSLAQFHCIMFMPLY